MGLEIGVCDINSFLLGDDQD